MKILLITSYAGNKGGLARYSHETWKALRQEGADVGMLTENANAPGSDEKNILIPVLRLSGLKKIKPFLLNCIRTRREAGAYDIIHACDGWPYAIYALFAVLGTSKKLFITGIGTYAIAPLSEGGFKEWLIRRAYGRASGIYCISDYVRDRILALMPGAKASSVFMGTNKLPPISSAAIDSYKKKFKLEGCYPIILSVGDIKDRKGQLDTLKALALLKNKYPKFMYVIFGSDADTFYVGKINEFAKGNSLTDNMKIVSNVYDDEVLAFYYQACDVFALNSTNDGSHFEGFGLVFLEAAQFGKPVVGSRGCGIESALKDGYNGYLTDQGDAKDIAEKIQKVLNDTGRILSANSLRFFEGFSWKKTAQTYLKEYADALDGHH